MLDDWGPYWATLADVDGCMSPITSVASEPLVGVHFQELRVVFRTDDCAFSGEYLLSRICGAFHGKPQNMMLRRNALGDNKWNETSLLHATMATDYAEQRPMLLTQVKVMAWRISNRIFQRMASLRQVAF